MNNISNTSQSGQSNETVPKFGRLVTIGSGVAHRYHNTNLPLEMVESIEENQRRIRLGIHQLSPQERIALAEKEIADDKERSA